MTDHISTSDIDRMLELPDLEPLGAPDLDRIHRLGTRRRRTRLAAALAVGTLALTAVAGTVVAVGPFGGDGSRGVPVASDPATPHELSPLAARALAEIPGAVQVSDWQVVIPGPGTAPKWDEKVAPDQIAAGTSTVGSSYTGVTSFTRADFPDWLYDGVQRIEQEDLVNDDGSYPVGSTEMGILVEAAEADLACVGPSTARCTLAMLDVTEDGYSYRYGLGTEDFLTPGAPMEVFLADDYSRGTPGTIAVGGIDGTAVDRVDFITTAGETVKGVVEAGTWSDGDSIFWANVPGRVAEVIAYDAAGEVIEDHPIRPCDGPEDCEVR